jgi:HK97 family phage portal protein
VRIFENGVMPALVAAEKAAPARDVSVGQRSASWSDFIQAFGLNRDGMMLGPSICSVTEAFSMNVWVRACIEAGPITLSQLPLVVYRGQDQLESTDPAAKKLYDLMAHPNEEIGLSWHQLLLQTFLIRDLFGECFWLLSRPKLGGLPSQIWIYHPWALEQVADYKTGKLLAWRIKTPDGRYEMVQLEDVAHFPRYDPLKHNPWAPSRGTSALVSAGLATSADIAAVKFNLGFFDRGLAPGGVISVQDDMQPQAASIFIDRIRAQIVKKYGEPLLLDNGATFTPPTATAQNFQLTESRKMNREEIAAACKVPPFVVGIGDQANYANARQFLKNWWQVALLPAIADFSATIQQKIIRDPSYSCTLSVAGVPELKEARTEEINQAIQMHKEGIPWDVINEWMDLGLGEFPGSDQAFVSYSAVPYDDIERSTKLQPEDDGTSSPAPKKSTSKEPIDASGDNVDKSADKPRFSVADMRRDFEGARDARDASNIERTISEIIALIRDSDEKLQALARNFYKQAIETGSQQVADLIGVDALVSLNNPRVLDFLNEKENLITSVNETTANRIADVIREMVGNGDTPEAIGREIRDLYNLRDEQATLIGRQEVGSALNGGRFIQMTEEGVTQHEWLSSRDDRVRDSHRELDGETVAIGEAFSNGLAYPQDPAGPPEETINCRCVSLPIGDERAARTRIADRAEYWRSVMDNKSVRQMQKRMTDKLQAYLYSQRKAVIKALADAGIAA